MNFRRGTWNICPAGYFLNGLYRSCGNHLSNIEKGWCCKPINHPKKYGGCSFEKIDFKKKGWTMCKKDGSYIAGLRRDYKGNWLHNIDYLRCCKMWTGNNQKNVFIFKH